MEGTASPPCASAGEADPSGQVAQCVLTAASSTAEWGGSTPAGAAMANNEMLSILQSAGPSLPLRCGSLACRCPSPTAALRQLGMPMC